MKPPDCQASLSDQQAETAPTTPLFPPGGAVQAVGGTEKAPVHRYSFPPQETSCGAAKELRNLGGEKLARARNH